MMKKIMTMVLVVVLLLTNVTTVAAKGGGNFPPEPVLTVGSIDVRAYATFGIHYEIVVFFRDVLVETPIDNIIVRGVHSESRSGRWLFEELDEEGQVVRTFRSDGTGSARNANNARPNELIPGKRYNMTLTLGGFLSRMDEETLIARVSFYAENDARWSYHVHFGQYATRGEFISRLADLAEVWCSEEGGCMNDIAWAVNNQIIRGRFASFYETYYDWALPLTRQDMALSVMRFCELMDIEFSEQQTEFDPRNYDVSLHTRAAVRWAFRVGLFEEGSDFDPNEYICREEMQSVLELLASKIGAN